MSQTLPVQLMGGQELCPSSECPWSPVSVPPLPPSPSSWDRAVGAGCFPGSAAVIPFSLSTPGAPWRGWFCSATELLPEVSWCCSGGSCGMNTWMGSWRPSWNRDWEFAFSLTWELHSSSIQSAATSNCIDTANLNQSGQNDDVLPEKHFRKSKHSSWLMGNFNLLREQAILYRSRGS